MEEGQSSIQLFSMIVDRDQGYGREIANGRLRILSHANLQLKDLEGQLQELRQLLIKSQQWKILQVQWEVTVLLEIQHGIISSLT